MPLLTLSLVERPSLLIPTEKKSATAGCPLVDRLTLVPDTSNVNNNPILALDGMVFRYWLNCVALTTWVDVVFRLIKSCSDVELASDTAALARLDPVPTNKLVLALVE